MSIYATLWVLRFPRSGDYHTGCEWVEVLAQGVPAHIGTPTPGYGYEPGDPYGDFLPPVLVIDSEDDEEKLRAVVFVTRDTPKGTNRSAQEYVAPLLVLSGAEYASVPFAELVERISSALRGSALVSCWRWFCLMGGRRSCTRRELQYFRLVRLAHRLRVPLVAGLAGNLRSLVAKAWCSELRGDCICLSLAVLCNEALHLTPRSARRR